MIRPVPAFREAALTAAGVKNFRLPLCMLRATLSGASGSPSADVTAEV